MSEKPKKPEDFELIANFTERKTETRWLDADLVTLKRIQQHREWLDEVEAYIKAKGEKR